MTTRLPRISGSAGPEILADARCGPSRVRRAARLSLDQVANLEAYFARALSGPSAWLTVAERRRRSRETQARRLDRWSTFFWSAS